jgi:hypothetical protein
MHQRFSKPNHVQTIRGACTRAQSLDYQGRFQWCEYFLPWRTTCENDHPADHRRRSSGRASHVFAIMHPTDPFVNLTARLRNPFSRIADNYFSPTFMDSQPK